MAAAPTPVPPKLRPPRLPAMPRAPRAPVLEFPSPQVSRTAAERLEDIKIDSGGRQLLADAAMAEAPAVGTSPSVRDTGQGQIRTSPHNIGAVTGNHR
ncbi:hypothetical protein LTR49_024927 [Elasticomyces elasticus]|nr:hypothetical protein LTR49_024927 [Elasticomyces elasticus]